MASRRTNGGVLASKNDLDTGLTNVKAELKSELEAVKSELMTEIRAVGVQVEQLGSHIRAVAEGVQNTREGLERKMSDVETRLTERMAVTERAVRDNSGDIQVLRVEVAEIRKAWVRGGSI
jgi:hypothetical protein